MGLGISFSSCKKLGIIKCRNFRNHERRKTSTGPENSDMVRHYHPINSPKCDKPPKLARAVERHIESKDGPNPQEMPWPWEMGAYCIDTWSGGFKHWPWPTRSYEYNSFALKAMNLVYAAHQLFAKPAEKWTPEEDAFYIEIMKASEDTEDGNSNNI